MLALFNAARRLKSYFQSYQVVVWTDHPIENFLRKPDLAIRMMAWVVELPEFGLRYKLRGSIKGQHLAEFDVELPNITSSST